MKLHELIERYNPQYHTIEHYPADKTVTIHKITEEWGIFSNFAHTPVKVDGVTFDTTERLFQVMKFSSPEARMDVFHVAGGNRLKWTAKHWEKTSGNRRDDWGRIIVDAMKFCLSVKYEQSEEFRNELERSRGFFIVEDQTSFRSPAANTWGAKLVGNEYVGPNLLGRLLMELRDGGSLPYNLPEDAIHFEDLIE